MGHKEVGDRGEANSPTKCADGHTLTGRLEQKAILVDGVNFVDEMPAREHIFYLGVLYQYKFPLGNFLLILLRFSGNITER
jgi:hypothetical protein